MPQTASHSRSKPRSPERVPTGASVELAAEQPQIPTEVIAERAYEKWLAHGCTHGCDREDWLAAEVEIIDEGRTHDGQGPKR